jgi:4-amino-4-deoxy-L-arabinose transferase-like glycosyltransferase
MFHHKSYKLHLTLLLVLTLAAWLRLWRLPDVPPGLFRDEAYNAMDITWMLDTRSPQIFFTLLHGREPMFFYLAALFMGVLGNTVYVLRLVSVFVGILTLPLTYRWLATLFADHPDRCWLSLIATAGLAFSFWFVLLNRTGLRANLTSLFVILTLHFFWQGWQRHSLQYFAWAGACLGLSQYTYLSARLLPLIFGIFALVWTIMAKRESRVSQQKALWPGLLVMAVVSFIVFLPLGLYFLDNPVAFFARSGMTFSFNRAASGEMSLLKQWTDSFRVFTDGYDPRWRHNLVGESGFDWFSRIGFWVGLFVAIRQFRQPVNLLLLISLLVLWLPTFLSEDISVPRLLGLLPIYYAMMAIGLLTLTRWITQKLPWQSARLWGKLALLALVVMVSGGFTAYNYFVRWANEPRVHLEYYTPLVDLVQHLTSESRTADVLLPFEVYVDPITRFLLYGEFQEINTPPTPNPDRPTIVVNVPDTTPIAYMLNSSSTAYVWLTRNEAGQGVAYVAHPLQPDERTALEPIGETVPFLSPYLNKPVAQLTPCKSIAPIYNQLTHWQSINPVDYDWGHEARLVGYEVWPDQVQPGQSPLLTLYWRSLVEQPFPYVLFIQLVNGRGEPIGQWTDTNLAHQYIWRDGIAPVQHKLWLSPQAVPGPYLVRIGLFSLYTYERLPLYSRGGEQIGDQLLLGLFYVAEGDTNPRLPQTPLQARLGNGIELLGYSQPPRQNESADLSIQLYWQANGKLDKDYTAFVQLLNEQNELITSWDSQPLAGQYPTSRWQRGEVVVDSFNLPQPDRLLPGKYRLVTGMYDLSTGLRLPAFDQEGKLLPEDMIILTEITVP